ncbi:CPBP family intramembrane glutamic endopeptidase [Nonomuraea typhae]|uniref:CPBP family intramembrane glutamic endopeptidase n=1 Tax=Nonomuraea typhae TaxID=2603600 RepID=UPI0012FB343D|nr:type II CAAX endopeptidase family protein [Nonomuraea typhae]
MDQAGKVVSLHLRVFGYLLGFLIVLALAERVPLGVMGVPLGPVIVAAPGVLVLTWLFRRLERRPWTAVGLPPPRLGSLALGLVFGAVTFGLVFALLWALGQIQVLPAPQSRPWMIALQLIVPLAAAFAGELAFRGYIFTAYGEHLPAWAAALVSGLLFAAVQVTVAPGGAAMAVTALTAVAAGVLLCGLRLSTGGLWAAIGYQTAWLWARPLLVGPTGNDTLTRTAPTGDPLLAGPWPLAESGLVATAVTVLAALAVILYGRRHGVRWRERPGPAPALRPSPAASAGPGR